MARKMMSKLFVYKQRSVNQKKAKKTRLLPGKNNNPVKKLFIPENKFQML